MSEEIYLKNIHIENYKSLLDTDFMVNRGLTALIGINGSGKTNTLSAIKLLKSLTSARSRSMVFDDDDILSHTPVELLAEFIFNDMTFFLKVQIQIDSINAEDEIKSFEVEIKKGDKSTKWEKVHPDSFDFINYLHRQKRNTMEHSFAKRYLPADHSLRDFLIALTKYLKEIKYYGATVFSDPSKSPISFELDEDQLASRGKKNQHGHYRFLYDLYVLKLNDKKAFKRYLNAVNTFGVGLVDDIVFSQIKVPNSSVRIREGGRAEKIVSNRVLVVPIFNVGQLQLSPNQLSEGTFKTLALIFYILNDDSRLVLIEEPEVCVHHGLLASIIELIKQQSKFKQVIISTHSDYVLDKISPEEVALVQKMDNGTSVQPLSKALSDDDYSALKQYLNKSGNLGEYWKEDGFSFK
jgi:AAA15 family ATPase/GTPase